MNRIVKASQGKSPGGTDRPELADGKVFEEMKAEFEQGLKDVNPVTPPPKKTPKTAEHVDLLTPSSSSTHTYISSKSASLPAHDAP